MRLDIKGLWRYRNLAEEHEKLQTKYKNLRDELVHLDCLYAKLSEDAFRLQGRVRDAEGILEELKKRVQKGGD